MNGMSSYTLPFNTKQSFWSWCKTGAVACILRGYADTFLHVFFHLLAAVTCQFLCCLKKKKKKELICSLNAVTDFFHTGDWIG